MFFFVFYSGILEPVRFVMETKVRVFPSHERFWYFTKRPLLNVFSLQLQPKMTDSTTSLDDLPNYDVSRGENL